MKFTNHEELEVYKLAFEASMQIFHYSMKFPKEEKYSLTDQIRRSSRSVCANTAEAAETRVWLNFACSCRYLTEDNTNQLLETYSKIIGKLIVMYNQSEKWKI